MNLKLYSAYDSKAKAWTLPFWMDASGPNSDIHLAFTSVCNDPSSKFGQFPEDYTMFEIGCFDSFTGTLKVYDSKTSIGNGLQFVKPLSNIADINNL